MMHGYWTSVLEVEGGEECAEYIGSSIIHRGDYFAMCCWVVLHHLPSSRWVEVPGGQTRSFHSATAFNFCPGLMEVTLLGGCPVWPSNHNTNADLP